MAHENWKLLLGDKLMIVGEVLLMSENNVTRACVFRSLRYAKSDYSLDSHTRMDRDKWLEYIYTFVHPFGGLYKAPPLRALYTFDQTAPCHIGLTYIST